MATDYEPNVNSSVRTALVPVDFSTRIVNQQTYCRFAANSSSAWRESNPQIPAPEAGGLPSSHHADDL